MANPGGRSEGEGEEMGPASEQEESGQDQEESEGEMESYRSLLQAGSELESTLQREYSCSALPFHHCALTRQTPSNSYLRAHHIISVPLFR